MDCPGSPVQKLSRLGIDFTKISCILLSHNHPDHIYGIPSLLHSLSGIKKRIKLMGTRGTLKAVRGLISIFRLGREKFPQLDYKSLSPGRSMVSFPCSRLRIKALKVRHSSSSVGFKFSFSGISLVYTGDTALEESGMAEMRGCDYLIHDCLAPSRFRKKVPALDREHTSALELGKFAHAVRAGCLIPIHFSTELPYQIEDIKSEIRKNYQGRLIIPSDFLTIELISSHIP